MELKFCTGCRLDRPVKLFSKNSKREDGLQDWCKECTKVARERSKVFTNQQRADYRQRSEVKKAKQRYDKERYKNNSEHIKQVVRQYTKLIEDEQEKNLIHMKFTAD